jgi:GNAT superfamily N-acetyltransferase
LPDESARQFASEAALAVWTSDDPEQAAAALGRLPAGEARRELTLTLAGTWAESDAAAVAQWAAQLPREQQAPAWKGLLNVLATEELAVNPDGRPTLAERAALGWLQVDPAAARAWIGTAPLPADLKRKLLGN